MSNENIISLNTNDTFNKIVDLLKRTDASLADVLNNAVAEVAAQGRKAETAYEGSRLQLGGQNYKWSSKTGHYMTHGSAWDAGLGGYVAESKGLRLINFSWETVAKRNKSFSRKMASAKVSSQLMNLWSKDTKRYTSSSPFFRTTNYSKWGRIKQGDYRRKRLSMSQFYSAVAGAMPDALSKVESRWQTELNRQMETVR